MTELRVGAKDNTLPHICLTRLLRTVFVDRCTVLLYGRINVENPLSGRVLNLNAYFFFLIHYYAPRETKPHVALRECVQYYVCGDMNEGPNNLEFFPHSKDAINTQRNYNELEGTSTRAR